MRFRTKRSGFTLIEIMIVILIMAVLLAIAVPNWIRAREVSRARSCTANLRQIETAKEQWAMDTKAPNNATPTAVDLVDEYMKGEPDQLPKCPAGGGGADYSVGDLTTPPTCAVGTNGTSDDWDDHVLIR